MTFRNLTKAEFIAWLRPKFKELTGPNIGKAAAWILDNLTDAQMKAVFNVTTAQLPALKTRLTAKRDAWIAARDLVGGIICQL